ncbi:MAG: hypothetical protein WB780_00620 [Candidatus Acidiferrales bacterium]
MRRSAYFCAMFAALLIPSLTAARSSGPFQPPQEKKEYLSDIEADKIRDAPTPSERIKLFVTFAEDRLKKFQYELNRKTPERKRAEILNSMLNAYVGCVDDAADQIDLAREKQADIRLAIKLMKSKAQEFLDVLERLDQGGPEYDLYKDTLEDAIEGTKDAITDIDQAEKEMAPPPVRRKPT